VSYGYGGQTGKRFDDDFNTLIANLERTFSNQAETAKQQAEKWERLGQTAEAKEYRTLEQQSRDRAAVAKEGFLLVDTSDPQFMMENQDIIARACKEHRIRHVQQPGERQPLPVQPGAKPLGQQGYGF
jgi:ElaB/YqjD/DUF883 family membrane-anchored ribosome-binding protein